MRTGLIAAAMFAATTACAEEPSTTRSALWGSPTVDNGACCKSLGEVRDNIDRLERKS